MYVKLILLTGLLLIIVPIAFNVIFFVLQKAFSYPDILRQPTDEILTRFKAGGSRLRWLWYAFTLSALLFVPVPALVLILLVLEGVVSWYLVVGTLIGVLAGVVQVLGLIRWPFLVPTLADIYTDPNSSQAAKDSAGVVFQAFHRYAGVAIGEHLGYLLTGAWTITVCVTMIRIPSAFTLFGWLGIIPALGILAGVFEETGWKPAGAINAIAYILWSLWLVAFGVMILVVGPGSGGL